MARSPRHTRHSGTRRSPSHSQQSPRPPPHRNSPPRKGSRPASGAVGGSAATQVQPRDTPGAVRHAQDGQHPHAQRGAGSCHQPAGSPHGSLPQQHPKSRSQHGTTAAVRKRWPAPSVPGPGPSAFLGRRGSAGPHGFADGVPGKVHVAPEVLEAHKQRLRPLLNALRFVESSNRPFCPDGDGGMSIGPLQISERYHRDAWPGTSKPWAHCRNLEHAENTVVSYWLKYSPDAVHSNDWETLAKIHNGGPRGQYKAATNRYWGKVTKRLGEHAQRIPAPTSLSLSSRAPRNRPRQPEAGHSRSIRCSSSLSSLHPRRGSASSLAALHRGPDAAWSSDAEGTGAPSGWHAAGTPRIVSRGSMQSMEGFWGSDSEGLLSQRGLRSSGALRRYPSSQLSEVLSRSAWVTPGVPSTHGSTTPHCAEEGGGLAAELDAIRATQSTPAAHQSLPMATSAALPAWQAESGLSKSLEGSHPGLSFDDTSAYFSRVSSVSGNLSQWDDAESVQSLPASMFHLGYMDLDPKSQGPFGAPVDAQELVWSLLMLGYWDGACVEPEVLGFDNQGSSGDDEADHFRSAEGYCHENGEAAQRPGLPAASAAGSVDEEAYYSLEEDHAAYERDADIAPSEACRTSEQGQGSVSQVCLASREVSPARLGAQHIARERPSAEAKGLEDMKAEALEVLETEGLEALEAKGLEALEAEGLEALETEGLEALEAEGLEALEVEGLEALEVEGLEALEAMGLEALEAEALEALEVCGFEALEAEGLGALEAGAPDIGQRRSAEQLAGEGSCKRACGRPGHHEEWHESGQSSHERPPEVHEQDRAPHAGCAQSHAGDISEPADQPAGTIEADSSAEDARATQETVRCEAFAWPSSRDPFHEGSSSEDHLQVQGAHHVFPEVALPKHCNETEAAAPRQPPKMRRADSLVQRMIQRFEASAASDLPGAWGPGSKLGHDGACALVKGAPLEPVLPSKGAFSCVGSVANLDSTDVALEEREANDVLSANECDSRASTRKGKTGKEDAGRLQCASAHESGATENGGGVIFVDLVAWDDEDWYGAGEAQGEVRCCESQGRAEGVACSPTSLSTVDETEGPLGALQGRIDCFWSAQSLRKGGVAQSRGPKSRVWGNIGRDRGLAVVGPVEAEQLSAARTATGTSSAALGEDDLMYGSTGSDEVDKNVMKACFRASKSGMSQPALMRGRGLASLPVEHDKPDACDNGRKKKKLSAALNALMAVLKAKPAEPENEIIGHRRSIRASRRWFTSKRLVTA